MGAVTATLKLGGHVHAPVALDKECLEATCFDPCPDRVRVDLEPASGLLDRDQHAIVLGPLAAKIYLARSFPTLNAEPGQRPSGQHLAHPLPAHPQAASGLSGRDESSRLLPAHLGNYDQQHKKADDA